MIDITHTDLSPAADGDDIRHLRPLSRFGLPAPATGAIGAATGFGPCQALVSVVVAVAAIPFVVLTLLGCAAAFVLRGVIGGGHG